MQTMKVETICKQIIKPSSTTPEHLRSLQLSVYDHILPPVYTVAVLFYTKDDLICGEEQHTSKKLKTSLSETLTLFYPLAGRINGVTVDCNDEGAVFVDARVNNSYPLSGFLRSPDFKEIQQLLPLDVVENPYVAAATWPLLLVKATYFPCGGMSIGICITHKIADASSISTFIHCWAATARGEKDTSVVSPVFAGADFYPPANEAFKLPHAIKRRSVTKRFVFSASKLEELRTKAASPDSVARPTRVESVTALLWKGFVAGASSKTQIVLIQPANLRPRLSSILPESLIGNVMFSSVVLSINVPYREIKIQEAVTELRKKSEELRCMIQAEVETTTSSMIGSKLANLMLSNYSRLSYETHEPYTVSSWCKLPLYETNFGWGSPVWVVGILAPEFDNLAMLIDSKDGQGIEALVTLPEENMSSFEENPELLAFASLNPSVLL